jgi:sulfur carrier protein ThiS
VRVHLWGELGFYGPGKQSRFDLRLEHEMPLSDALRLIGVPEADVAIVGLNGDVVPLGDPTIRVADGDRIDCYPPTSGG